MPDRFQRILQLAYLAGSKYGIDRMKILHRLIEEAVLKETEYAIKRFLHNLASGASRSFRSGFS